MRTTRRGVLAQKWARILIFTTLFIGVFGLTLMPNSEAIAPQIVINELMYSPASGDQSDEYVELYNTTGSSIDVSGWCFTQGVNACLPGSSIVPANGFLLLSPDSARSQLTYGFTPAATYTGNLSNGGELLELQDDLGNIVFNFTYSDSPPWPTVPDGLGPSLELREVDSDYNSNNSWGGSSLIGGTPGQANSISGLDLPILANISEPVGVNSSSSPTITVEASNSISVTLSYKVMFDTDQDLVMYDDGAHGDGAAGDGIYGANIPAQNAGSLVRYKVVAENTNGSSSLPGADDTIDYHGYVVGDGVNEDIPVLRWYMNPDDYTDMITDHLTDDVQFPAVVVIGDYVIDNALVRTKGLANLQNGKKKYKFELPQGHKIGEPYFSNPVDEFAINRWGMPTASLAAEQIAWKIAQEAGFASIDNLPITVYRNGDTNTQDPQGLYLLIETYDKSWRERNGYQNDAIYKEGHDKRTRLDEDDQDITDFYNSITTLQGEDLKSYLLDNIDVAEVINYHSLMGLLRATDWSFYSNSYQRRNTEGTQRWSVLPWDLDSSFAPLYTGGLDWDFPLPTSTQPNERELENAMYQFEEFQEMYHRRTMQLFEDVYGNEGQIDEWMAEIFSQTQVAITQDLDVWRNDYVDMVSGIPGIVSIGDIYTGTVEGLYQAIDAQMVQDIYQYDNSRFRDTINQFVSQNVLPAPQPDASAVGITEIMYNPQAGEQLEYIELYNPHSYAVDISNWQLSDAVGMTFKEGSVIPAGGYAVVVKNDVAFRSGYSGSQLVLGEYDGDLANSAETISLSRVGGSAVLSVNYSSASPWSGAANGQGYSLSLLGLSADPAVSYCWAHSASLNGTPGATNSPNMDWVLSYGQSCSDIGYAGEPNQEGVVSGVDQNGDEVSSWGEVVSDIATEAVSSPSVLELYSRDRLASSKVLEPVRKGLFSTLVIAGLALFSSLVLYIVIKHKQKQL